MIGNHQLPAPAPIPENLQTNPELELASELIRYTNKSLFLTGKAGSGKTTFLKQLRKDGIKRMAIVAPTGVAAINAGGMTIHSLFQLPFGLQLPGVDRKQDERSRKFAGGKVRLLRSLELLVIDEVSMVRADLLDGIDEVLRRFRDADEPFGGVQLLMIGDLHQLPPVAKPDEWQILSKHYQTPYFYSSHALQKTDYQSVELKHIFRQSDLEFIGLLNKVRDNRLDGAALRQLNTRYIPEFKPSEDQPYITLTTTNAMASEINASSLTRLPGPSAFYEAQIKGEFPPSFYPTDLKMEFKPGAQVMFIRNDQSGERRYYNGRIGRISRITDGKIFVECPGDSTEIEVLPAIWENLKYSLNESTQRIEENVAGTFQQIPLKLAWAITIHKSQGLTFERAIIDAQSSFASGQVYVALSRCKSFEGIVLRSPIFENSVKIDPEVQRFSKQVEQRMPTVEFLQQARRDFERQLLVDLFNFGQVDNIFRKLHGLYAEHSKSLTPEAVQQLGGLWQLAAKELVAVTENFAAALDQYLAMPLLASENGELQSRLQKASSYFNDKLSHLLKQLEEVPTQTDNQSVNEAIDRVLRSLKLSLFSKLTCFRSCAESFTSAVLQQAKTNAELEFTKGEAGAGSGKSRSKRGDNDNSGAVAEQKVPHGVPNPELYRQLLSWRQELADARDAVIYEVFPNATLRVLVEALPVTLGALKRVHGIGKARLEWFGRELCERIAKYCQESGMTGTAVDLDDSVAPRSRAATIPKLTLNATQQLTLELHRTGKTIDEIVAERGLARGTIESHLADAVALGLVSVDTLVEPEVCAEILAFVGTHPEMTLSEIKTHFGEKFTYGELKLAISSMVNAH